MKVVRFLSVLLVFSVMLGLFSTNGWEEDVRIGVLELPKKDRDIAYVANKWNKTLPDVIKNTEGFALANEKKLKKELKELGIEPAEGHGILPVEAPRIGEAVGADLFVYGNVMDLGNNNFEITITVVNAQSKTDAKVVKLKTTKKDDSIEAACQKLLNEIGSLESDVCTKYLVYAIDYIEAKQWDDAYNSLENVLSFCESDTQKAYAYTQRGNICAQQRNDVACAKENYMKAYEITKDWRTLAQLGVIYEGEENGGQLAVDTYQEVLTMIPQDSIHHHADLSARIGMVYQDLMGDEQNAIQWYEKALQHDPNYDYAIDKLLSLYFKTDQYAQAEKYMQRVVNEDPSKATTWYLKFAQKYEELAASYCAFEKESCYDAAKATPENIQQATRYYEKAIGFYTKLIEESGADKYYLTIGSMYDKMEQPQKAIEWHGKYVTKHPEDVNNYCRYLFALEDAGQKQKALDEANRMAKEYPNEPCPYAVIGQYHQGMRVSEFKSCEDMQKQINYYERAVSEFKKGLSRCDEDNWLHGFFTQSIGNLTPIIEDLRDKHEECVWSQ